jgi:iron complex outermembrane receptor protein
MEFPEEMYFASDDLLVSTSGREEMRLAEVPEAVFVISSEQIKHSGATNIPELLRLVPGMDVVQLSPSHYEVNARDHEGVGTERLLLLIDSRLSYFVFLGSIWWGALPVVMEEIERIEVVLGPGSTLYGANAFRGIVNIITKKTSKDNLRLRAVTGPRISKDNPNDVFNWDNVYLSGVWWKKWDKLSLRFSGSYVRMATWEEGNFPDSDDPLPTYNMGVLTAQANWTPTEEIELTLRSGLSSGNGDFYLFSRRVLDIIQFYVDGGYDQKNIFSQNDSLQFRAYFRGSTGGTSLHFYPGISPVTLDMFESLTHTYANYRFTLFDIWTTVIGGEARFDRFLDTDIILDKGTAVNYYSAFIQERLRLFQVITLTVGARLETKWFQDNDSDTYIVPKGSIVYTPHEDHVLRFSAGQAIRALIPPESFGNMRTDDTAFPIVGGNPNLDPEKITSIEGGYQYTLEDKFSAKLNMFYSWVDSRLELHPAEDSLFLYSFVNASDKITNYGGELYFTFHPNEIISFEIGYSLNISSEDSDEDIPDIVHVPIHKAMLAAFIRPTEAIHFSLNSYFMSVFQRQDDILGWTVIDPYAIVNLKASYAISSNLDLVLSGYNILDSDWGNGIYPGVNREHQIGSAERIGRRIMLGLEARL